MKNQATLALDSFMSKYQHKFDAKPGYIDMRTMSKNYPDGVIPCDDLDALVEILIGPAPAKPNSIDPRTISNYTLQLIWAVLDDMGILTEIQRDMIPNHSKELEVDFDGKKISVILAMKDPVTGKICPFDGKHTRNQLRRQGWTVGPVFLLEAQGDLLKQPVEEQRKELMRQAGEAFLSINLTHKKPVGGYDAYIIKRDYGDADAVAIGNILYANNCKAVRIARDPGDISHYPFLWNSYELLDRGLNKGRYLDLALNFHISTWPLEQIYGATLIGLANFFYKCERARVTINKVFFDDQAQALKNTYKLSKFTHEGYKTAYINAHPYGSASDDLIVTCGFVHTYNKHVGKVKLYTPELQFGVK